MEKLSDLEILDFPQEVEKMAIRLAAYNIIKELANEGFISEEELVYIHDKNEIPVE